MSIEDGQQVLPTEGFDDFADETNEEAAEVEDQINAEQELNDKNIAQLEADDPGDIGDQDDDDNSGADGTDESDTKADDETSGESTEETDKADTEGSEDGEGESEETEEDAQAKADEEAAELADKEARDKEELSKKEKFERYSRGVQRKINKEVKKRGVLEAENEALRTRLDKIESRMTKDNRESDAAVLANRLRNATAIKQQLMEDGEFEQVAKVDNDIIQMRIKQSRLEETDSGEADVDSGSEAAAPQQQQQQQEQYVPDLQTKWIQSNERFGKDAAYTGYVNSTYDALIDEGYDPESASMYEELNARTGTAAAKVADTVADADAEQDTDTQDVVVKPKPKAKPRPQSAPTPNVTQAQKPAISKSGITEADKINMRNWGLDPNDKSVRQEWLNNKRGKK